MGYGRFAVGFVGLGAKWDLQAAGGAAAVMAHLMFRAGFPLAGGEVLADYLACGRGRWLVVAEVYELDEVGHPVVPGLPADEMDGWGLDLLIGNGGMALFFGNSDGVEHRG